MQTQALWQISLGVSAEAAEAVSLRLEELLRAPASVYTQAQSGRTSATVYLEKLPRSSKSLRLELSAILRLLAKVGVPLGTPSISIKRIRRENWAESWKRHFKPIEIGRALLIKPSWSRRRVRPGQALIILDPGLSFGTGHHATTLFCLEQLAACRRKEAKQSFLDIGTGSGILAVAAAKLGYSPVEGFDFDPEAVRIAQENASQNGVEIRLRQEDLTRLPRRGKSRFDVICANLIYDLLVSEAEKICERLKPGGRLIAAGILREQFSAVEEAFQKQGLKLLKSRPDKEWQSGEFTSTK